MFDEEIEELFTDEHHEKPANGLAISGRRNADASEIYRCAASGTAERSRAGPASLPCYTHLLSRFRLDDFDCQFTIDWLPQILAKYLCADS